jgi:hypothetical protein
MSLIKNRVKGLLTRFPNLRNSDNKLIATIWKRDLLNLNLDPNMTAISFLYIYSKGQLTNAETIRRVRQKIQEENPDLRGTAYGERQKQGEEVRKEI